MINNPVILSIIIPVYGTEKFLKRCINSVINQSYKELEIIIVNDFSPGNCKEIVKSYQELDNRIKYVEHDKNYGLLKARITGAKIATGSYIAFLDSDDYISRDFYRAMILKACNEELDIIANETVRRNENGECTQFTMHSFCFPKELRGKDVQNAYFEQAGVCYAWHTIWNKIYKKALWDKCMPAYCTLEDHIIMTEDIAFSSIIFFNAQSFASIKNGVYYYCINQDASTNSVNISYDKFKKNVTDIIKVFDFVNDYLFTNNASEYVLDKFKEFRERYAYLWNNLKEDLFKEKKEAGKLIDKIAPIDKNIKIKEEHSFERNISDFCDDLEKIRDQIASENIKVISFDIFDTLVLRPVWEPEDIYILMQYKFEQICPNLKNIKFIVIRQAAEKYCREKLKLKNVGFQDVTLTEIYCELKTFIDINDEQIELLKQLENDIELDLIQKRTTGKQLLDFALSLGKKVILTSDMYLEKNTIEKILVKCGYQNLPLFLSSDIRLVKFTGDLYEYIIDKLQIKNSEILHIGDNWQVDILIPKAKGIKTAFLPKTKDVFCNSFHKNRTNGLSCIGNIAGNYLTTWNKTITSLPYRSMLAMIANKFFDNPFRAWNKKSDFDANPCVIGYYPLGMHILSVCVWLGEIVRSKNIKHISFLARDGFLPIKAFNKIQNYLNLKDITVNYVPCSRKALMPWIINDKNGLLNLPVSLYSHSPLSLIKILKCCCKDFDNEVIKSKIFEAGFIPERKFISERGYYDFLKWFSLNLFSIEKLEKEKNIVSKYYKNQIPQGSLVFDLGYSGRIPSALSNCLKYSVNYAYVHKSYDSTCDYIRRDNLDISVLYDFVPQYRDLIREIFFSEINNQCIGFIEVNNKIEPIFDNKDVNYSENFIINKIFEHAICFVDDYLKIFTNYINVNEIEPLITSMPFEGLLSACHSVDKDVLASLISEDSVYGNKDDISMAEFWCRLNDESSCIRRDFVSEGNIVANNLNEGLAGIYQDGLFIKLYHKINNFAPIGSNKRRWLKKLAAFFIK